MIRRIFTLYFLFVSVITFAQINEYGYPFYNYYGSEDYNAYDQFWDIVEDENGLIYAANNFDGILQFDGVEWRKIQIEGNPEVRNLAIDSDGLIYVGCSGSFGFVQPTQNGNLEYVSLNNKYNADSSKYSSILKVNIINDKVYFSSDNSILFTYHKSLDTVSVTKLPEYSLFTFKVNDQLYGSSYLDGLYKIKGDSIDYVKGGKFYKSKNIFSIIPSNGQLKIVTGSQGVFMYNPEIGYSNQILTNTSTNYLKNFISYDAEKDNDDLLLATIGSGAVHCDSSGNITNLFDQAIGLKDHICASVHSYRNSIWCALGIGIARFEYNSPFRSFSKESDLEGFIIDVAEFHNKLYVATEYGIYYQETKDLDFPVFEKVFDMNKQITSMIKIEVNSGNEMLIIGTTDGVYQLDRIGGKLDLIEERLLGKEKYSNIDLSKAEVQNTTENLWVSKLFQSTNKNMLFIGTKARIILLEYKNENWNVKEVYNVGDGIDNFVQDIDGKIWAATKQSGLVNLTIGVNHVNIIDTSSGLPVNYSLKLLMHSTDLLCSSPKGIYLYNRENGKFSLDGKFPEKYLSKDVGVFKLLLDNDNNIYVNYYTNKAKGVDKLIWNDELKNYSISEDFKRLGNVEANFLYEYNNAIWFGVSEKLYSYNKNSIIDYQQPYKCLIRKVEGLDSAYFYGSFFKQKGNKYVPSNIQSEQQKPILKYAQNDITFYFSAPYFEGLEAIEYSYKLVGFKTGWSKWNSEPKAVFTNLNEGKYTFQVKAKNIYNIESEIGQYEFSILPPWYRTLVAFFIYFIAFIFFIWVILKLYTRRLLQEKIRLEGIVQERTAEIREQRDEIVEQKQSIEDSIQYASRIQRAILPSADLVEEILPEHFILFRPRDIVSGDYYWMNNIDGKTVLVAADCTGHGVPGAFMSMLGVSFLNAIVIQEKVDEPHLILNKLRERVKKTLKQEGKEGEAKDGMDVAIVVIDDNKKKLYYAGAYNPVLIYRNDEMHEIKADRMPIGIYIREKESFTLHEFDYQSGDTFYIFSDGFPDQFGGEKGQKFRIKTMKQLIGDIQKKSMAEQKEILNKTIIDWMGDEHDQIDDMVVVGVRL